ncbi:MAG: ABC transporter permease [Spirochaetaceae bacterium]|jgi:lipoprotein-releasing system permease protein|nr:ABC transporter permease [Spirochaetaceae bacterium]
MGSSRWIGFIAGRYVSSRRRDRASPSPVLAVLGIFTGVLALTVILAVMNGFQMGFIESILEVSSYHIRVESFPWDATGKDLIEGIRGLPYIPAVVPFREFHGIVRGNRNGQQAVIVRGISPDALKTDRGMAEKLVFEAGVFDITFPHTIVLGAELARRLAVSPGDELTLVSLSGFFPGGSMAEGNGESVPEAEDFRFLVTGIFRSGFYEYDLSWAFINIETARRLEDGGATVSLGIKLQNRWQVERGIRAVRQFLETRGPPREAWDINSWQDYNRAFFGALRTEKLFMFLLVGLIFIVVGLNIFQAQRRAVLERREEIGLLRAIGASDRAVRLIFVWDGFIIGLTGSGLGISLGLLIAGNINLFFSLLEGLVNGCIGLLNGFLGLFGGAGGLTGETFAVFSPAIFYIKEIPSRIIPYEVLLIFLFGFLSALLAAWFASGKVSQTRPAEVLRYE